MASSSEPAAPQLRRRRGPVGASPGSLIQDPQALPPRLRAIAYGPFGLLDEREPSPARIAELRQLGGIVWLDVSGLGDIALLQQLGAAFGLHRLALEDVVGSHQRAKIEDFPGHQFVVLRMVDHNRPRDTEQLSICFGDGFLITFQERPGDCFDTVRQRLADPAGRLRSNGPDYLAYALLDAVVDAYFPALESIGDRLQDVEERIVGGAKDAEVVTDLHDVRRDLLVARRALWPLREATSALVRGDAGRFAAETRVYLRDVHDHVVQLLDLLENYRELGASLMDLHLAAAGNRLNEVMKVLTVIATIFIPLTFVVGVYGMNFDMPELHTRYGYPCVMLGMLGIGLGMIAWFRRRGWI